MADAERPYPNAEHYEYPVTAHGVLTEETRLYPTAPEMVDSLKGLQKLYTEAPLLTYYHRLARFMFLDEYDEEAAGVPPLVEANRLRINSDFLAGTVMGVHTIVEMGHGGKEEEDTIEAILKSNPLNLGGEEGLTQEEVTAIEQATANFRQFHTSYWRLLFINQPPAMHQALESITDLLFAAEPNKEKRQDDFVKGYLYALVTIVQIKDAVTSN